MPIWGGRQRAHQRETVRRECISSIVPVTMNISLEQIWQRNVLKEYEARHKGKWKFITKNKNPPTEDLWCNLLARSFVHLLLGVPEKQSKMQQYVSSIASYFHLQKAASQFLVSVLERIKEGKRILHASYITHQSCQGFRMMKLKISWIILLPRIKTIWA